MTEAVIVSTARTPLCKSWHGAFNMTHGATMGGHAVKAALERAKLDPAEVEDVIMGCANPEGATGFRTSRARSRMRAGMPVTVSGMTVNRFCSSGLQTVALAAQRILAGEADIFVAGGVESISCVQNETNKHMVKDAWLSSTSRKSTGRCWRPRRKVVQALQDRPRSAGPLRGAQPAARRGGARRRQDSRTRSCRCPPP